MDSNVPMMVYDNMDYIFTWNGGQYVYVYEGTMTDSGDRAMSTPLNTIDLVGHPLNDRWDHTSVPATLAMFGDRCDQWTNEREREDMEPEVTA